MAVGRVVAGRWRLVRNVLVSAQGMVTDFSLGQGVLGYFYGFWCCWCWNFVNLGLLFVEFGCLDSFGTYAVQLALVFFQLVLNQFELWIRANRMLFLLWFVLHEGGFFESLIVGQLNTRQWLFNQKTFHILVILPFVCAILLFRSCILAFKLGWYEMWVFFWLFLIVNCRLFYFIMDIGVKNLDLERFWRIARKLDLILRWHFMNSRRMIIHVFRSFLLSPFPRIICLYCVRNSTRDSTAFRRCLSLEAWIILSVALIICWNGQLIISRAFQELIVDNRLHMCLDIRINNLYQRRKLR